MTLLEKEQVLERDATTIAPEVERAREAEPPVHKRGYGRMAWALIALIVAALAAVAIALLVSGGDDAPTELDETVAAPTVVLRGELPLTAEELTLMELAEAGYIPREAVDWELMELKALVGRGLIPAQTLQPALPQVDPLYTAEELTLMELAEAGYIPREAVDWELMELKQLANMGLIPREAVR